MTEYFARHHASLPPLLNPAPRDTRTSIDVSSELDLTGALLILAACILLAGRLKKIQDLGGLSQEARRLGAWAGLNTSEI